MPVTPKASLQVRGSSGEAGEERVALPSVLSSICDGSWVVSYGNPQSSQAVRLALQEVSFLFPRSFYAVSMFGRGWRGPEVRRSYL